MLPLFITPRSRQTIYIPSPWPEKLIPPRIVECNAPPPLPFVLPLHEEEKTMPKPTAMKKSDPAKIERRRPPLYRPKSRTDSSMTGGSRIESGRLRGDGGGSSDEEISRENLGLRQRLQEEASLYRRRLDTYRQAQQNQAALVSRLQSKVLQYKQKCADLEAQMDEYTSYIEPTSLRVTPTYSGPSSSALEQAQQHLREVREDRPTDLETAIQRLQEERKKSEKLLQINKSLKDQLEESHSTNEMLTADLQKLTNDFEALREEMLVKEDEWKDEEQAFNDYYSTEHNRLLNLWRDVVSVKRLFMDVQSITERDLNKLKTEVSSINSDVCTAFARMESNTLTDSLSTRGFENPEKNIEIEDVRCEIEFLKRQNETCQAELEMKQERIQELLNNTQALEERCAENDQAVGQLSKMQDDIDILQAALRDIAHALIQDAETKDMDILQAMHLHLSASTQILQKSPKRSGRSMTSPAAFAESTISAVHAALHKYQSYIHELQVKLQSNKEQLLLVRKQFENSEDNVVALEKRTVELVAQLDNCRTQCTQLAQGRESIQKSLDTVKTEKNQLERTRLELNVMVDSLNLDYQKLQNINNKIQKELDTLHEDKLILQSEVDRLHQESELREITFRGEEDKCSRMREELLNVREELNKLYLQCDMLEQQKLEANNMIESLEKSKLEYALQIEKLMAERSDVHDSLAKKETAADNLQSEKKKLQEDLKRMENDKIALQHQCNDQQNDIQSLRKELLQAEQQKLDLESEKVSQTEKCKFLEIEKGKIEMELNQVTRERNDLSNQLTVLGRKRDLLNEELVRCRQRLEQATETNARINRNLEELVKECQGKQCVIDTMDKDIQRLQELLAAVRSEKEALEAVLFDTQTNLETTDEKRNQTEKELNDLLIKHEQLKAQVVKLTKDLERSEKRGLEIKTSLTNQVGNKEIEFKQTVDKLKQQNEENIKKLIEEKEKIRTSLEKRIHQSLQKLKNEKDAEIQQLLERSDNLQNHIDSLCQQHEEIMLRAESDKQQALLIAHHDQQALQDRLEEARKELESERETLERLKREANSRFDQDRLNINHLKEEVNKFKIQLEEHKVRCEEEKSNLSFKIEETRVERDTVQNELENLKVQLHLYEDKYEAISNQLHETIRKLKESENSGECLRKELTDARRLLTDSNFEKEKYHNTNKELRDHIKRTEGEKRELNRQLEETFQKIANLEDMKVSMENERVRLQNQLREIEKKQISTEHTVQSLQEELHRKETAGSQQQAEEKELQARLLNEVEERERSHQEVHQLRKQISELERGLEQTRQELSRNRSHSAQLEEQWHAREQDLLIHLEDSRVKEKRLEDQKHNLEVCLVDATQQIQELKAKIGGAEGKLRSLENQIVQLESVKRELEQKLSSIISTLRRIGGIQLDGTVTMPYRLLSPSRRWSPARGHDDGKDGVLDIDPEVVRKGIRNMMQQVAQIERERDDYKTQIATTKKQLQEAHENQSKGDHKITKVLQNLRVLQEEKSNLEAKLAQKNVELKSQSNALDKKTQEAKQIREKVVSLELSLSNASEEKLQYEDKIEKMKISLARLDSEKRALQEELARIENRSTKIELQRMSAEGDLQRLQMMLQDKESIIQKLQEKCEFQNRTMVSLEERCVSLKSTIDQLNSSLEKASQTEGETKSEIQRLQRQLMEANTMNQTAGEKLKHLQKTIANCENERRVLAERLEANQQNLAEMRRNNQILQDQVTRLNNELANNEVQRSGLESQLRLAQWPQNTVNNGHQEEELRAQLSAVQRERNELRGKIDLLNNKLRQMESENRTLERSSAKPSVPIRSKSYERQEKYETDSSITELDRYQQENRELRAKLSLLESELDKKESELSKLRNQRPSLDVKFDRAEIERYRAAQLQAERLLEAREQSHRQQVSRLENQVKLLREQLNDEIKRRQQYVLRSTKAGREMQQLRQALGDSLRTVSQDPALDALLLEHEARKLDNTLTTTSSLPPSLGIPSSTYNIRSITPQPK